MSKAIFPIKRVIIVENKESNNIKLFRTLRDACNKLKFRNSYESIARYVKINGYHFEGELFIYWKPVYGKHNPKGVLK